MVKLRDIWQTLYPYGIFRVGTGLSAEGGLSAQRSFSATVFQRKRSGNKVAYLTFDDGPIPEVTPEVLAILAKYNIKATFFMVGENIDKHPDIFAQVIQAGHTIGNHTYNHLKGWRTPFKEYMANVAKFPKKTDLFRPPYGKATLRQRISLHKMGYRLIYWDILTRDYETTRTPEAMLAQVKRETRPGSIINFHDSLKSNERMLAVLPLAIEWLLAQGYEIKCLN